MTGRRGIQIWMPVAERYTFDDTSAWVERLSRVIGATVPDLVSWEWEKSKRKGLARLDYTQNAINKTLVAPFSARPRPGAPVSVPISWDELDDPDLRPDRWTIRDDRRAPGRRRRPARPADRQAAAAAQALTARAEVAEPMARESVCATARRGMWSPTIEEVPDEGCGLARTRDVRTETVPDPVIQDPTDAIVRVTCRVSAGPTSTCTE